MPAFRVWLIGVVLAAGCGPAAGNPACGITALAGATMVLDQFQIPGQTMGEPPAVMPSSLAVRIAAGPALRGVVQEADGAGWTVRIEGDMPAEFTPGFGVLIAARGGAVRGVLLYTGRPVSRAPQIGSVTAGGLTLPLLGLETDISGLETADCPYFPDSLARR